MLIIFEFWIFWRVHHDLGTSRLVGKTELSGAGEIQRRGIYGWIRHPRYTASFLAILGACFLAGTRAVWVIAATWLVLMLVAISFEEREMRTRFGEAYADYCSQVPRFVPIIREIKKRIADSRSNLLSGHEATGSQEFTGQ